MKDGMESRKKLFIMNLSGVYETEDFYKDMEHIWVECRDIQGTNCYCDEEAEALIKERMESSGAFLGAEGIHFLDSGNYHYLSKIWLEQVEEDVELLVFDHHTDMQPPMFGNILSCGGWIKEVLENNPRVKRVWLAGPPEEAAMEIQSEMEREGKECRVVWFSEKHMKDTAAWKKLLGSSSLPLYISVDKDVLSREYARTNWDQGNAELSVILEYITAAASCRGIIGMDVCGENPEGEGDSTDQAQDISINNSTNKELICCFLEKCGIVS